MTDEVAAHVLRDNYEQNVLLGNARAQAQSMLPVHERLIHSLEDRGELDRGAGVPADRRRDRARVHDGLGLTSPEFAVLVAYSKIALKRGPAGEPMPDDPWFHRTLRGLLPAADQGAVRRPARRAPAAPGDRHERARQRHGQPRRHHLRLPGAGGGRRDAGAGARAYVVCREIFGLRRLRARGRGARQPRARRRRRRRSTWSSGGCSTGRCGGSSPRGRSTLDIGAEIERFRRRRARAGPQVPGAAARRRERKRLERKAAELVRPGVPEELARARGVACSTRTRCSTSSTSRTTPAASRARSRRCTTSSPSASASTRCSARSPACRATTGGTPWPGRAARRPVRGARVAHRLGHRGRRRPGAEPAARGRRGSGSTSDSVRAPTALSAIRRLEKPDIAALSVALRTLRGVIRVGASGPDPARRRPASSARPVRGDRRRGGIRIGL